MRCVQGPNAERDGRDQGPQPARSRSGVLVLGGVLVLAPAPQPRLAGGQREGRLCWLCHPPFPLKSPLP